MRCCALAIVIVLLGCQGAICTPDALSAALAAAHPGDAVEVGPCEIAGSFSVPAGVALHGAGPPSILRSVDGAAPILDVAPGEGSRVASLALQVDHGGIGLRCADGTELEVADVEVRVTRGVGIGARDVAAVSLDRVDLAGPVTAASALGDPLDPAETGAFGLVARTIGDLQIVDLHASGFAVAAVAVEDSAMVWIDGDDSPDVEATRGVGVALFGGESILWSVEIAELFAGRLPPGVAIAAGPNETGVSAHLVVAGGSIADGEGYGVFVDRSEAELSRLDVHGLDLPAVRVQGGSLVARELSFANNQGAGVIAIDARSISIEASTIAMHSQAAFIMGATSVQIGDGVHVVRSSDSAPPLDLRLDGVVLDRNARAGLLLDGRSVAPLRTDLTSVRAIAADAGFGVVEQNTPVAPGWDTGVTREGTAMANDLAFPVTGISVLGIMMPPGSVALPPPLGL